MSHFGDKEHHRKLTKLSSQVDCTDPHNIWRYPVGLAVDAAHLDDIQQVSVAIDLDEASLSLSKQLLII